MAQAPRRVDPLIRFAAGKAKQAFKAACTLSTISAASIEDGREPIDRLKSVALPIVIALEDKFSATEAVPTFPISSTLAPAGLVMVTSLGATVTLMLSSNLSKPVRSAEKPVVIKFGVPETPAAPIIPDNDATNA